MRNRMFVMSIAMLALTGCAGVPTTSEVHYVGQSSDLGSGQFIRVIANPPVDGMSPTALVNGFLDACADPTNNYQIAREYLTDAAGAQWDPTTGTRVFDAASLDVEATGLRVSITAKRIAAITALGRYSRAVSSKPVLEKLTVAKNRVGQWRINSLPDGLLLGQSEVDRSYRAWAVYYVDPSHTHVVADSVTLPAAAKGVPTMLVQALLSTPAPELAAGVVSGFPAGTALTYGSVPVVGGIAQVDLTADALLADRPSRRAMAAQLTWTLQQLPSISGVRLTVSGQQLTVPGTGVVSDTQDWSSYSPAIPASASTVYAAAGASVNRIDTVSTTPVASLATDVTGAIASLAVEPTTGRIAAVLTDGSLVTNAGPSTTLSVQMQGSTLSRPTWDRDGNVLVADFGRGVWSVPVTGKRHRVTLGSNSVGSEAAVRQVAVAPDGSRVALVMSTGTGDVVALGVLSSTKGGFTISGVHRIEDSISGVRDVVWSGPLTVAVLGSQGAGSQMLVVNVGSSAVTSSNVPTGTQSLILDNAGNPYVAVSNSEGSAILKRGYGRWATISEGVAVGLGP